MASSAPMAYIGNPDLQWGTWGQGLLTEWWETAADLIWPQSVVTYGRMRHDPQIRAVLAAYILPIMRATWAVDPDGCRDEVVGHVADDLGLPILGHDDQGPGPARRRGIIWHRHLRQALNYLIFGHMPFERRYEPQPDGYMRLAALGPRMPWTIANMRVDSAGVLQEVTQNTQNDPIPGDRLAWYVHDQEGANWAGISMLRPVFGAWLLKHETWRVHATSIRRFGMGVPSVEAPPGATAAQVAQARQLASNIRAGDSSGIGLPAGFKAALTGLIGSVPDALAFIQYLDHAIAKMALTGLIDLGQTETGSRALGDTFMDLFQLSTQSVADDVATVATSGHEGLPGIVTDLVDQNWGEDEPAPRIVCTDVGQQYEITALAIQQLTATGAISPDPSLDEWVRKTWRLPARTTPWAPTSRGVPAVAQDKKEPTQAQDAQVANEEDAIGGGGATAQASALPQPAAPSRKQAAYVEASQWEPDRHQQDWEQALAALLLHYRTVMSAQRTDLVDRVIAAMQAGKPQDLALAAPGTGDGPGLIANAMTHVAMQAAQEMAAEAQRQGVQINLDRVKIDAARLAGVAEARARVAASYMAQQAGSKALQVYDASPRGFVAAADEVDRFLAGLSNQQVREQLGAALTAAQNHGRIAALEAAPESAGTAKYVAAEFLDRNTCDNCRKVDGREFDSLQEAEAAYPTGGYADCQGLMRCRGTVVAMWGLGAQMPRYASAGGDADPKAHGGAARSTSAAFNPDEPRDPLGRWLSKGARVWVPNKRSKSGQKMLVEVSSEPRRIGETHVGFLAYRVNKDGDTYGQKDTAHLHAISDVEPAASTKQVVDVINPETGRRAEQTPSKFTHPDTGHAMGKTEIGDTFEALFADKAAHLLEAKYGGAFTRVSGGGGPRNTPLDFRIDHTYGGELKTLNAAARNQKTAIKAEEIARKDAAVRDAGYKPLLVVQVVDTTRGRVEVYEFPAFASKSTKAMAHLGGYDFGPADFRKAQEATGHWEQRYKRAGR